MHVLLRKDLQGLFDALKHRGFALVGPTRRDAAIVYDEISSVSDLPEGWTDKHSPGSYGLEPRKDKSLFGYVVPPNSWKSFLYPPVLRLFSASRSGKGFALNDDREKPRRVAFIGVRPCELRAMQIQDEVFTAGTYVDPAYEARRRGAFVVVVNCAVAREHCFCESMGTGPRAAGGYDLALTEILEGGKHFFLLETGSAAGEELLKDVTHTAAGAAEKAKAAAVSAATAKTMGRKVDAAGARQLLYDNGEHARWDELAKRCLACANCTMVCPTCFCSGVDDVTDLTGEHAERWRRWDSCFTMDFAKVAGGNFRPSVRSRYRQWLTHKFSSWVDQFGSAGCVGCGRCITWCPVGIDVTAELEAIRTSAVPAQSPTPSV
jgi:sulfhydrogenase subunit beta (sulfur reductase)